jgi:hypothetical protein
MDGVTTLGGDLARLQKRSLSVAAVGGLALAAGALADYEQFLRSWLLAFLLVLSLPLGSLALTMLHSLTGGSWGLAIRRVLEASMRTLPLVAIAFLPVALGIHHLYEWSHPEVVAADPILTHKAPWLNTTGFLLRAAGYFALWGLLAWAMCRFGDRLDRDADEGVARRMRAVAAPGLGLYVVALTLAAVDWAMSLEPHWFSTLYGLIFVVGQGLATFAFAIVLSAWLVRREPHASLLRTSHFHDLGKLLFAFVFLWAYLGYSQYLIIWTGNLAEETPWYLHRSSHGWQAIAIFLIALHFVLPFAVLLTRKVKRTPGLLAAVAGWLLLMRLVDLYWLIVPAFHHEGLYLHWMDVVAPLALGALWLSQFARLLARRPERSARDAQLLEAAGEGAEAHA